MNNETTHTNNDKERKAFFKSLDNVAPRVVADNGYPVKGSTLDALVKRFTALDNVAADIAAADDWRTLSPRALSSIVGLSVRCAVAASTDATPADLAAAVDLSGRLAVEVDESPRRLYGAPVYFRLTVPFGAYRLARFFNQISRAISAHFGADIVAVFVVKG